MIIKTDLQDKISKEFFKEFITSSEITKKIYPKSKNKSVGAISDFFNKLKFSMDEENRLIYKKHQKGKNKGKSYTSNISMFRLNLNFFFDYAEEKGVKFIKLEKDFLNKAFNVGGVRKEVYIYDGNLIEGIKNFLIKYNIGELIFPFNTELVSHSYEEKDWKKLLNDSDSLLKKITKITNIGRGDIKKFDFNST